MRFVSLTGSIGAMLCGIWLAIPSIASATITFEDLTLPGANSYYNGKPPGPEPDPFDTVVGDFISGGVLFKNSYTNFGGGYTGWDGWAYSNVVNNTTPGFGNQYAAYTPTGGDGSANYAVTFPPFGSDAYFTLPNGEAIVSLRVANTTYGALSMKHGDGPGGFGKKFGDDTSTIGTTETNFPDYLKLTITGKSGGVGGTLLGTVDFYLADYRDADDANDYIVNKWTTIDLSSLAGADTFSFSFETTDVGDFGPNTPLYIAVDNIVTAPVPEPTALALATLGIGLLGWRSLRRRFTRIVG